MNAALWIFGYLAIGIVIAQFLMRQHPPQKAKAEAYATAAVLIWPICLVIMIVFAAGVIALMLAGKKGVRE